MCDHLDSTRGTKLQDGEAHQEDHARWSRRDFLTGLGLTLSAGALTLAGFPVRTYARTPALARLAAANSDRILVIVQLAGGNDGLNTVVPYQDSRYFGLRPGLALRSGDVLPIADGVALHGALAPLLPLYQEGALGILQSVGYADATLSHFESTDYWMSSGVEDEIETGWGGRYLESQFPDLENARPAHPAAVQFGSGAPMLFRGPSAQMGMTIRSLQLFDQVAATGELFQTEGLPDSLPGSQLRFVRAVANDAYEYAAVIQGAAEGSANHAEYATNGTLPGQLAAIARLIRGGLQTRIYHVSLGSFDTHSAQAGRHSALLSELGVSLSTFMDDLAQDGLDERVLVMTFSEFGRRPEQNGSSGTDHGTAAPLFMLGKGVSGGLHGPAPDLGTLDPTGNLHYAIDFREVYAAVLQNWFGIESGASDGLLGGSYAPVPVLGGTIGTGRETPSMPASARLNPPYPNPASSSARVEFRLRAPGHTRIELFDVAGRLLGTLRDAYLQAGAHHADVDVRPLSAGTYFITMDSGGVRTSRTLRVIR